MNSLDCKTRNDIYLYLVSNLEYISEKPVVGDYTQMLGFRQKMMVHQVWYNTMSNKWAFHVSDDTFTGTPNMGEYDTFPELLEGVVTIYAKLWNRNDASSF
jgi:hypothetical protein